MPKKNVRDAFSSLGITPDVDLDEATKIYRRLAMQHHPDKNPGDTTATRRFQEISHSWDICQRYYEGLAGGHSPDEDDMDFELEDELLFQFYMFMLSETLNNRFNHSSRRQYKNQHFPSHNRPPPFFGGSPEFHRPSYSVNPEHRQEKNTVRQHKQHKEEPEYKRRERELELEREQEDRKAKELAMKQKADMDQRVSAQESAFHAARSGNAQQVVKLINEYNLDVGAPRNLKVPLRSKNQGENSQYETLLHAAACRCDENLFKFLLEKGANPSVLNKQSLNPFHVAIKAGNSRLVHFILEQRGKAFQDYHPSKATLSGTTPLQLAIASNDLATIELLVKHATTHDVERCWKQTDLSNVKEILRTKKGFYPPGECPETSGMSKKAQRQHELAQEKEIRIAEERRRAEINRQKREELAAKRIALAAREEEHMSPTKVAEEEAEQRCQPGVCRAASLEADPSIGEGVEVGVRARELSEEKLRNEAEANARELSDEKAAREGAETQETNTLQELLRSLQRDERERQRLDEKESDAEKTQGVLSVATLMPDIQVGTMDASERITTGQRREEQKERWKAKWEERKAPTDPRPRASVKKPKRTVVVEQMDEHQRIKHELMVKQRAEQSARDREHHREMMERRKMASPTQTEQSECVPLTPVSGDSVLFTTVMLESTLLSSGTPYMEDSQTCILPDDLFRDEQSLSEGISRIDRAESPPTRNPHRKPFKYYRSRRGAYL